MYAVRVGRGKLKELAPVEEPVLHILVAPVVVVVVVALAVSFPSPGNFHEIGAPSFGARPKYKDRKSLQKLY